MLPPRNILLFHLGALGDFILTWPLALAASRIYPQSRVIYVTHGNKGKLAEKVLRVESTDIEAGWHHLYSDPTSLPAPAGKWLAGAHHVISFIACPDDAWAGNVRRLAPATQLICLEPTPPPTYPAHATDYLLAQLVTHKALAESARQMIRSIADRGLGSPSPAAQSLVIHPGAGGQGKCWPAANYLELARRLARSGRPVRVLLGEVEQERWPQEQIDAFAKVGELRRPQTYLELLASLADAKAFIGNDSGPGHLAAAVGVPTLSLFGPTNPATWRPIGPRTHVMQRTPLEAIGVEEVEQWAGAV